MFTVYYKGLSINSYCGEEGYTVCGDYGPLWPGIKPFKSVRAAKLAITRFINK